MPDGTGDKDVLCGARVYQKQFKQSVPSLSPLLLSVNFLFIENSPGEQSHTLDVKPALRPEESIHCFLSQLTALPLLPIQSLYVTQGEGEDWACCRNRQMMKYYSLQ